MSGKLTIPKSNDMHHKIHVMHMEYYILISYICWSFLRFPMALLLFLDSDTTLIFRFPLFLTNPRANYSDTFCYDDPFFLYIPII